MTSHKSFSFKITDILSFHGKKFEIPSIQSSILTLVIDKVVLSFIFQAR